VPGSGWIDPSAQAGPGVVKGRFIIKLEQPSPPTRQTQASAVGSRASNPGGSPPPAGEPEPREPKERFDHLSPAPREWSREEEEALRLWIALARSYQTFAREVGIRVSDYGLTVPQFGILEALYHLGPLSLGELADKLLVTGGNITYVMDRLEKQGLVERHRSDTDRRVVEARLTPEGRAKIASVFPGHAAFIRELVSPLGREERQRARELLKRLGKGIARTDPEDASEESDEDGGLRE
jgi:MarR family transcriptional regulator, 2-MHQ and catechol-resistance regulon repressor